MGSVRVNVCCRGHLGDLMGIIILAKTLLLGIVAANAASGQDVSLPPVPDSMDGQDYMVTSSKRALIHHIEAEERIAVRVGELVDAFEPLPGLPAHAPKLSLIHI